MEKSYVIVYNITIISGVIMNEQLKMQISEEDLRKAFVSEEGHKEKKKRKMTKEKRSLIFLITGIVGCLTGGGLLLFALLITKGATDGVEFPVLSHENKKETYSALTGAALTDVSLVNAPTYCMQTPNGLDGARPQAGLNEAGVIFEAIAEAGITRFAAIYQNPTAAVIGPIRSLRTYYLEWDVPFNCTVVHAGGSGDALAAISAGGYRDLTEDYQYMYRGTHKDRLWNNLFTTANYLKKFNADKGYNTSEVHGFERMTPTESGENRVAALAQRKLIITEPADGDTSAMNDGVGEINIQFGGLADFNVNYKYDATSNTYLRSYASGSKHEVYSCAAEDLGEKNPEEVCNLVQMAPAVVIAMVVNERRAADNYHEDIDVIGSGNAYIFQNGTAISGSWQKTSREDQIKFTDGNGEVIKLAPGQTFISAIPDYGSVDF